MLPMPGSPSFSWPMFRQRMQVYFDGVDWNVAIAFWLFGNGVLIDASLYLKISNNRYLQASSTTSSM